MIIDRYIIAWSLIAIVTAYISYATYWKKKETKGRILALRYDHAKSWLLSMIGFFIALIIAYNSDNIPEGYKEVTKLIIGIIFIGIWVMIFIEKKTYDDLEKSYK